MKHQYFFCFFLYSHHAYHSTETKVKISLWHRIKDAHKYKTVITRNSAEEKLFNDFKNGKLYSFRSSEVIWEINEYQQILFYSIFMLKHMKYIIPFLALFYTESFNIWFGFWIKSQTKVLFIAHNVTRFYMYVYFRM